MLAHHHVVIVVGRGGLVRLGLGSGISLNFVVALLDDSDLIGNFVFSYVELENTPDCLRVKICVELLMEGMIGNSVHALALKEFNLVINKAAQKLLKLSWVIWATRHDTDLSKSSVSQCLHDLAVATIFIHKAVDPVR